jgi:hypothetical protein
MSDPREWGKSTPVHEPERGSEESVAEQCGRFTKTKKAPGIPTLSRKMLATQTESRENLLVALGIGAGEIVKKLTATRNEAQKSAT